MVALIAGVFVVFSGGGTPSSPGATPPPTAIVVVVASDVSVRQPGTSDFVTITKEAEVRVDSEIKTSLTGTAKIFYPNGTVTNVEHDTHVKVQKLDASGGQSRLQLITGSVWAKIRNVLGKGEFYEIQTENVVANVRGTVFGVQFRNGATRVIGVQHSVRVDGWDAAAGQPVVRVGTQIDPREKLVVQGPVTSSSAVFRPGFIMPDDLRDPEIKRNMIGLLGSAEVQDPMIRDLVEEVRQLNPQDSNLVREIDRLLATPTPDSAVRVDTSVGNLKIEVSGLPQVKATPTP